MEKLKIKIILGTTRQNRFGERPAKWIFDKASKIEDFEVELLDLRDYPMPFFNEPMSPASEGFKYPDEITEKWANKIDESDGFVIVTPEYNHGYSAVLKNAIDYTYYPWNKKAVGFVAYGSVGGSRAIEQLRQVAAEVQMASTRTSVLIPEPWMITPDDKFEKYEQQADTMLEQLIWWAKTLKLGR